MPYLVSLIWGALALSIRSLVGRVIVALGISYVTFQGVDTLISSLRSAAFGVLSGIDPAILGLVGLARIGESISVVVSAVAAKYALQGLTGTITKMAVK
jgi:D-alanyl-lipoteichoic acid acyltransferase DltB (MBOAT superfamily)